MNSTTFFHMCCRVAVTTAVLVTVSAVSAAAAHAGTAAGTLAAPADLNAVITNIRDWLVGLLAAFATLLLTIGGVRYILAGGDPGEVQKAKTTLRNAALGYAFAALAPLLVEILTRVVGNG